MKTGNINYEAANHPEMTEIRSAKVANIARDLPPQTVDQGPTSGKLALVGWGSTYGPIRKGGAARAGAGARRRPHPPAPHLAAAGEPGRAAARVSTRSSCRR